VRDAHAAGNVGGARFARGGQQIRDQLDIILQECRGLGRARLAETARLGAFGGQARGGLGAPFLPPAHHSSSQLRGWPHRSMRQVGALINGAHKVKHNEHIVRDLANS